MTFLITSVIQNPSRRPLGEYRSPPRPNATSCNLSEREIMFVEPPHESAPPQHFMGFSLAYLSRKFHKNWAFSFFLCKSFEFLRIRFE